MEINKEIDTRTFAEKILSPPTEENLYLAHFNKDMWSLEEFSALMGGISPEKYERILKQKEGPFTKLDLKRITDTQKVYKKFLSCLEEIYIEGKISLGGGIFYMTPWRYIKWLALNDVPIKTRFFDALPLYLIELYLEFQPNQAALRNKSKFSRVYHEALYLKNAQDIINKSPDRLTRDEIYSHPQMENVLRQIRSYGGNYKKRTITDSWLPKLEDLKRGRPKKNKPQDIANLKEK